MANTDLAVLEDGSRRGVPVLPRVDRTRLSGSDSDDYD